MAEFPSHIGQYEVLAELGSGGMAEVYLGRHTQLGNAVAIKILDARYAKDPSFRQRFVDEARIQANLKHASILAVQDIIAEDDLTAIVMEYLDGIELSLYLKSRTSGLPVPQFLSLVIPLAEALAHAHEAGIVHRDIKPSNIFLARQGKRVVPKLMDFGIAKLLDASIQSQQTAAGTVLGTPQFMAPEQFEDASTVDARADVFAFGSVMYLLLSRRLPFRGDGVSEIMRRVLMETPEALTSLRDDLPPELDGIVSRCLEKKPAARYQTMAECVAELLKLGCRIPPVPWTAAELPETDDKDGLREKFGLGSTTGETLTRRNTDADDASGPASDPGDRAAGTAGHQGGTTIPSRHAMPAVRPEGSGGVIQPGPPPSRKKSGGRGWLWVLLVILAGGGAGVGTVMYLHQGHVDESPAVGSDDVIEAPDEVTAPKVTADVSRPPRRIAETPSRVEAREPRGAWPALPAAAKVHLGSRLHHPPHGERDRHLSALLALGWEGLDPADLEDEEEAALGISAGELTAWLRSTASIPGVRRLMPHTQKAIAPFSVRGLKRSHLDHVMEALGNPKAARYLEFQVRLQCETFHLVDRGQGDQLGRVTAELLSQKDLTFEAFQELKAEFGKDPLLKAEIATRVLACITEYNPSY